MMNLNVYVQSYPYFTWYFYIKTNYELYMEVLLRNNLFMNPTKL